MMPRDLEDFIQRRNKSHRILHRLLNRVPGRVIWFVDSHFNHLRRGQPSCVSHWFCDYTDWRTWKATVPEEWLEEGAVIPPGIRRKGGGSAP
jgi:hypothetical protein